METKKPRKIGRPSLYTSELADTICERLAAGESLVSITRKEGMPVYSTITMWLRTKSDFLSMYTRAKEASADFLAEQLLEIADEEVPTLEGGGMDGAAVQRQRLRVDARKWIASKLKPKKYGERQAVEHTGSLTLEQLLTASREPAAEQPTSTLPAESH